MTLKLKDTMSINYKRINLLLPLSLSCMLLVTHMPSLAPFLITWHQSQERLNKSLLACFPLFSSVYFQLLTPEAHFWIKYLTTIIYWGFIKFLLVNDPPFIASLKEHILIRNLQLTFSLPRTEACKIIFFLLTKNKKKNMCI